MKTIRRFSILLAVCASMMLTAWGATVSDSKSAAIASVQQAQDPSAVVAAFTQANTAYPNDPQLLTAYVGRMAYLGLPEIAYHQALTLTGLDPKNGLAWAVVAHVDARKGNMPDAISAIMKAAHNEPDSLFVQRTAGEMVAWYDMRANQTSLPNENRSDIDKLRSQLAGRNGFTKAYTGASQAYASQAQSQAQQQAYQAAPAQGQTETQPQPGETYPYEPSYTTEGPLPYYPDNSYYGGYPSYSYSYPYPYFYPNDYYSYWGGPYWGGPWPNWWWPSGVFLGFTFVPNQHVFIHHDHFEHFNHHEHFENHGFEHHGFEHGHAFAPSHGGFRGPHGGMGGFHGGGHGGGMGGFHGGGGHAGGMGGFHGGGGHGGGGHGGGGHH